MANQVARCHARADKPSQQDLKEGRHNRTVVAEVGAVRFRMEPAEARAFAAEVAAADAGEKLLTAK